MPHTLTLTYAPPLVTFAATPLWRRLLSIATEATTRLTTLWNGLFQDARAALPVNALAQSLEGPQILEAYHITADTWQRSVETPARRLLVPLLTPVLDEAAQASEPSVSRALRQPVSYTSGLPETAQWVAQYVGTEIRDISATTLRTVQRLLREGWQDGKHPRTLARELRQVLGLTPRQQRAMERFRATLQGRGYTAAQIEREVTRATQQALHRRALVVSRTESLRVANMGAHETLVQSVRAGFVEEERIRRQWLLTPGACPEVCGPIPGMNPDGVGLHAEFNTPNGPMLLPPGHPQCRCTVTTRVLGWGEA